MNRDDVLRMAMESELLTTHGSELEWSAPLPGGPYLGRLHAFAALVAAHEREGCAKLCETFDGIWDDDEVCLKCAAVIRARGES